jgi:hypothetical protein
MKNGYIAAVLNDDTTEILKSAAGVFLDGRGLKYDKIQCKHIVLAYEPTEEVFKKYEHLIGTEVEFTITGLCYDQRAAAFTVDGVPSEKAVPHITFGVMKNTAPSYSNLMLIDPDRTKISLTTPGWATVRFVQHQGTKN